MANVNSPRLDQLRKTLRPLTFAVFAGSQILDILNVTGVTFALPSISEKYGIPETEASWVLSAYSLTFGSFLLIAGRLGDVIGHHTVYSVGLLFFSICSAICAGVDNVIALYVVRALQGIAAACTIPTSYALVATTFTGKSQQMAISGLGACQATGAVVGTLVGGAFTTTSLGYKGLFWLSFALSMIFAVLAFILIPPSPTNFPMAKRLDYPGAVFITVGALLLVFGFTEAPTDWQQAKVIAPIVLGGAIIIFFLVWEEFILEKYFSLEPLIPRKVWSYHNFGPVLSITGFTYATFFIILLNGSQFLIRVQDRSQMTAAIQFLPTSVTALIAMFALGAAYGRVPPKWVIAVGEILAIVGILLFSRNEVDTNFWRYTFSGEVVMIIGMAGYFVNYLNVAISSAPNEMQGLIAGILQTAAQLGTALGFAIASSLIRGETREELKEAYRNSFYTAIAFAAASFILAVLFIKSSMVPQGEKSEEAEGIVSEGKAVSDGESTTVGTAMGSRYPSVEKSEV
ncbi:unnamed protein product [Tuber melanosporum]|uniref:(Perigord truffle) hypothetical protein n=1 Tax=Tuber melanosporum (strain Mel28) TaxID=656061 RepID=D5GJE9_TUBMM|nr:uncharacterized protein GSTUM_00008966001 [Tuber melanosporum]CAZ84642.1 unnamed protein product [Tuber melanosporum]